MAMRIYLQLKANNNDIVGKPEQETVGGEDVSKQIEILDFELEGAVDYNDGTGAAASERRYKPIKFRKAVDKTSPELAKAFTKYMPIEATFTFFRTYTQDDATGGAEEGTVKFYTVKLEHARIVSMRQGGPVPYGAEGKSAFGHPIEDVELAFKKITWEHVIGRTSHIDTWAHV